MNASGDGAASASAQARPVAPPPAPPAAPTNFAAAAGDGQVGLSWNNPNNATITKYQYHHASALEWKDIPGSGAGTTGYTVTGLTNGALYAFQVRAVNAGGNGVASASAQARPVAPPAAPTNIAPAGGNAQVALSWSNPNNATITKYQYRQSSNSGISWSPDWTDIPGSGAGTTGHTVTGLTNGILYTFQVRAVNAGGDGAASASAQARPVAPPPAPPAAPTNFAAAAGDGQVGLSWNNPNNATITKYQYHHASALEWKDIPGSGAGTTGYTVTGLTNGALYAFQVRAVNAGGNGVASASAQATPVSRCDFNNDGAVDQADTDLFTAVFGLGSGDPGFDARMDLDGNGTINYDDFFLFAACYGS